MTFAESAAPLSVAARPDLTGGRRVAVLLSHGFTGSPASIRPWGEHLGSLGYAVEVPLLPGHGTTWQDLNTRTWADWYATLGEVFTRLRDTHDAVVVGGLSMGGALALRLAADHADAVSGVVLVNPAVSTKRLDVKLLPVLKHVVPSFPGIANDIKMPGVEERGYTRTPLRAIHTLMQAWPPLRRGPAAGHRAAALLPLHRRPRRRRLLRAADHREGLLARGGGAPAAGELPRGHPRQRRPADLHGVGRVRRPRHRRLVTPALTGLP